MIKYLIFICLVFGISNLVMAHRPGPDKEKAFSQKDSVKKKAIQVKPVKATLGSRWSPKRPKDFLASIPMFLNPLFSQLHFLKPNLTVEPDSVGA